MLFEFSRKLESLRRASFEANHPGIEAALNDWAMSHRERVRPGVFRALSVDVVYAFHRHTRWTRCDAFRGLMLEYLGSDYGLDRVAAEDLLELITEVVFAGKPSSADLPSDEEFLRHLLVLGALARNDRDLVEDIGLGAGVLRHLRRAAEHATERDATRPRYCSGIDERIGAIMTSLGHELRMNPVALEHARLRDHLEGGGIAAEGYVYQVPLVFDLLVWMGKHRRVATRQVASWLAGRADVVTWLSTRADPNEEGWRLLRALSTHGLVYSVAGEGDAASARWVLTDVAENWTAEAFARAFWKARGAEDRGWGRFGVRYQCAIARAMPEARFEEFLGRWVASLREYSTAVIEVILRRAFKTRDEAWSERVLGEIEATCLTPSDRSFVLKMRGMERGVGARELSRSEKMGEVPQDLSSQDV